MSIITFDTLKFVDRLEKAGMPREQATAFAQAQQDSLSEALESTSATKIDIVRLENRIEMMDAKSDAKFDKLSWMMGILIALAAANFAKQFF